MRSKTILTMLTMAAVVLLSSGTAQALKLHNFDCAECHKSGLTWTSVDAGNICLQCHGTGPVTGQALNSEYGCFWDGTQVVCSDTPDPDGATADATIGFSVGDASNKLGSNGSPVHETSHNWGANIYNAKAGSASNPADPMYNSTNASRNASGGYVTCFRCHDPHGAKSNPRTANNKLLRLPGYDSTDPVTMVPTPDKVESTCVVCHADWAEVTQAARGLESHPLVTDYPTFQAANSSQYQVFNGNGEMSLMTGGNIGCTTCHGLHNTDSDSGTIDGPGVINGDGAMLKGDGVANDQSSVCQSCHIYQPHPSAGGNSIGCMVCHSGHSYNNGNPNLFVLRGDVTELLSSGAVPELANVNGPKTGISYTQLSDSPNVGGATPVSEVWGGTQAGVIDGYCEGCHGNIEDTSSNDIGSDSQYFSDNRDHAQGDNCYICHDHSDPSSSFEAKGCDTCHGSPPAANTAGAGGFADDGTIIYAGGSATNDIRWAATVSKDESNTPHPSHASADFASGEYAYSCSMCHNYRINNVNDANGHQKGTFQNVLEGEFAADFSSMNPDPTYGGILTAPFNAAINQGTADWYNMDQTTGTCDNLYCHSNGGTYTGVAKVAGDFTTASVNWAGGKGTIIGQVGECSSCHGNSVITMAVGDKDNSQIHNAHLDRGYTCNVCHNQTIDSSGGDNNTIVNIAGGNHVDGTVTMDLDTTYNLGTGTLPGGSPTAASCSVYCHSDGAGTNASPDWADAASGACGTCHTVTAASLPDAHARHLTDALGPQIATCSVCHTHNGEMTPGNDHVDGNLGDVDYANCQGCHGTNGGAGFDADLGKPEWVAGTASCESCHIGVLSTIPALNTGMTVDVTAPDKSTAVTTGHNLASGNYAVSNTGAANKTCDNCHNAADTGHFDNNSGDDQRLIGGVDCNTCHGVGGSETVVNIITHQAQSCETCHDPHGSSNIFMVRPDPAPASGTIVFTAQSGVNSYDEDDGAAGGAGEVNADDVCATCHTVDGGTLHNNSDNSTGDHNQGLDCFTCHKSHTNAPSAFAAGAGTNCGDCHGFPPASGAHATHTTIVDGDLLNEDNTDCAVCHTGADSYTYSPAADQGASLNHSNAAGRVTILGTSVGYSENGTPADLTDDTCTSACHVSTKPGNATDDGFWTDTDLLCNACHGGALSGVPTGDAHDKHIAASYGCADCHVGVDAAATSPLTHNDAEDTTDEGTTLTTRGKDHVNTTGLDAEVNDQAHNDAVNSFVNGAGATDNTCSNTYCHDPSGGNTVDWDTGDSTTNCAFCHADTTGDPTTGSHTQHLGAATNFGLTVNCLSCHPDNSGNTVHLDGTVDLPVVTTPATDYTDGVSAAADLTDFSTGTYGGCTTTTCHNDGTGTAVKSPIWGVPADNCTICHNDGAVGSTLPEAAPANGKHGTHVANTVFVPNVTGTGLVSMCDNCHGTDAETAATHIDGTADKGLHITSYAGASCANDCHTDDATDDWAVGGTLTCDNCHDSGKNTAGFTGALLDRGWPNGTNDPGFAHGVHILNFTATAYGKHVSGSYCIDCHNDNNTTHSAIQGNVTSPLLGAEVTAWDSGQKNCANSCHVANKASDWIGTARECTDCHTGTFIGGGGNRPQSGLHEATVALAHDVLFDTDKTCTSCHAPSPTVPHINGALQDSVATAYSFNATFITSYSEANGCAAKCHSDNAAIVADDGKWSRKWVGVTDAKPTAANNPGDAVCDNCHNDGIDSADGTTVDDSWNTGVSPVHGTDWDGDTTANEVLNPLSNHSTCQACHGWGNAAYDETWGTGDHGDGNINMNGPGGVGAEYDQTAWGCAAACHSGSFANGSGDANENHVLADSTWPVAFADFGSGDCDACHAGLGADHTDTNEDVTIHGLVSTPTGHGASSYITDCADCHTHDGISVAPGTGDHNNGTVNFNGTTLTATNYDRDASNFNGSCTNTCHDTDAAGEWAAGSLAAGDANGCLDCHDADVEAGVADGTMLLDQNGYPPTSNKHTLHLGATASLVDDCNDCHGASANSGGQAGHKNSSVNLAGEITAGVDSCTNNCHDLTGANETDDSGAGDDARWQAADADSLGCADCHNNGTATIGAPQHAGLSTTAGPSGDRHAQHVSADADYVGAATCTTCHTHSGALSSGSNGHVDATLPTLDGTTITAYPEGPAGSCTNTCHVASDASEWTSGTLNCTDCHNSGLALDGGGENDLSASVGPNAGRHDKHMANTNYVSSGCADCHGHSGSLAAAGHVNGPTNADITLASKTTAYAADDTCTNSCHDVVNGRDWIAGTATNGTVLACADCHNADGNPADLGTFDLDQGNWPPSSNAHAVHSASNALPNAVQSDCYACHTTTVTNAGSLVGNTTHLDLSVGDLDFNANFDYELGTAGRAAGTAGTTTCSAVECHNGVTTPTWATSPIACGDCHGSATNAAPTSGSTAGSHVLHTTNDSVNDECVNCHTGNTHQNLTVDVDFAAAVDPGNNNTYGPDADGVAGVNYSGDGADDATCATIDCHFNTVTPAWGTAAGAFPARCDNCHNDGLTDADDNTIHGATPAATDGIHKRHTKDGLTAYVDDCNACHGANASTGSHTGHANLATTYGNSLAGYAAGNCTTNLCHDDAASSLWVDASTLACNDCHSDTGLLNAGGEVDLSATVGPNAGRHDVHMARDNYVPNNCTDCHGHSGSFAAATHADGPNVNTITVGGDVTSYTAPSCANNCHNVTDATDGDWVDSNPLTCSNCHGSAKSLDAGGDPWTSVDTVDGKHGTHAGAYTYGATGQSATGAGTTYNFGCGECHAGTHLNGTLPVTIADVQVTVGSFSTGDKSCGTSDCHNDGTTALGAPAATGNGNLNWGTVFTGDRCNKCHGNIPNSGAHTAHQVGIHWEDVYTGTTGLLTAGTEPSGHGGKMTDNVTPTSTVINCQVCHFNTVQDWYNDKNSTCATSCHNGTDVALQGDVTIAQRQNHITGSTDDNQAEVTFFGSPVRSKAQLRNDIEAVPEIGNNWKRMNDGVLQNLFYKGANAYDETEALLNTDTYTGGATPTCTTQCHNGNAATWVAPTGDCSVCHTQLPQ